MNTKKRYTTPFIEEIRLATEDELAVAAVSGVNIHNTGEGDGRDPGSIDYDNSGEFGDITPAKQYDDWDLWGDLNEWDLWN
jgi:hypothetical protein